MYGSVIMYVTCDPITIYCLELFVVVYSNQYCVQTNEYDQSLRVTDIYILTKFEMLFHFWVMGVESEEEDDDEQNSLS